MRYEDILAKYGGINFNEIPTPEFIDQFIDELMCCDETKNTERSAFGIGILLGMCTVLSYLSRGRHPDDMISRLTQFMLQLELFDAKEGE